MENNPRWDFDSMESAMREVGNVVYKTSADLFEELERRGLITVSGHHIAQMIAHMASEIVSGYWEDNDEEVGCDEIREKQDLFER
jgi:hypothetical protein